MCVIVVSQQNDGLMMLRCFQAILRDACVLAEFFV